MGYGRYTDIRVQPVVPEITLQEATFAPLQRQQRRDNMYDKLSQMNAEVNRTAQDDPLVSKQISEFDQRRKDLAKRIAKSPNDPSLSEELFGLSGDINKFKTTGTGFQAQQAFDQFQKYKGTYLDASIKSGNSAADAERNFQAGAAKLKEEGKWGAFNPETGEVLDYTSNATFNIPQYIDRNQYVQDIFKDVTGYVKTQDGRSRVGINEKTGLMTIVDTENLNKENKDALQAALNMVNNDISNPNSRVVQSMEYQGQDVEGILDLAKSMVGMKTIDETTELSSTRFHNMNMGEKATKDAVRDNAIVKIDPASRANPFGLEDGSTEGMTDEDVIESFYKSIGVEGEGLTSLNKFTSSLGATWDNLKANASAMGNLTEVVYWALADPGTTSDYVKAVKIKDAQTRLKTNLIEAGYSAAEAANKLRDSFGDALSAEPEELKGEEKETLLNEMTTYYNGQYSKKDLEEMSNSPDKSKFNALVVQQVKQRTSLFNQTYNDWGSDPASIRAKEDAQKDFNWETLNMPTKNWTTSDGQSVNVDDVITKSDLKDNDEAAITVSGFAGIGNPTNQPSAYRLVVRDADGNEQVYWSPTGEKANFAETVVQNSYKNMVNSKSNNGVAKVPYGESIVSMPWRRVEGKDQEGKPNGIPTYEFLNPLNNNEVAYTTTDPISYLSTFALTQ